MRYAKFDFFEQTFVLRTWHKYPLRSNIYGNRTNYPILNKGTEADWANNSETEVVIQPKQREIATSKENIKWKHLLHTIETNKIAKIALRW